MKHLYMGNFGIVWKVFLFFILFCEGINKNCLSVNYHSHKFVFCFLKIRQQIVKNCKFYWKISGSNGLTYQPVCKSPCKAFCSKLGGSKHKIEINQAKYYFVNCSWMNGKWFSEKKTIKQNILRLKGTVSQ